MADPRYLHGKNEPIYPYLCCACGAILGWFASGLSAGALRSTRIESALVGAAGAAVGGIVIVGLLWPKDPQADDFSVGKLALGIAGAVVFLLLLSLFRKKVGPMREHKKKAKHHFYD